MAHKAFGGWLFNKKVFAQIQIADQLWTYSRKDGSQEEAVQLFFIGWYKKGDELPKLFSVVLLWATIKVGLAID